MDAITKFQKFLVSELEIVKENLKQIRNSPILEENEKILLSKLFVSKNYLRLIQIWRKKIKIELFYDFEPLCILLKCANMKATDCFKILITSIESNIATGFLDDNVDNNQIVKFQFKVADSEKDLGETVVNIISEDLGLEEENYKLCCENEKIAFRENPSIDLTTMKLAHNTIKIHYLEKKETYESEDIEKIVTAFSKLQIPANLCQSFQIVLEKNLSKRHQKTQKDSIVYKKSQLSKQTDSITTAEYKAIRKQIETSYNEYTGKILIPITEESRNQIARLMIQLD